MSNGMLITTLPYKQIRHPDFGARLVQNGMLFFMDGSPMGLPEQHRVAKPAPALATDRGRPVAARAAAKPAKEEPAAAAPPAAAPATPAGDDGLQAAIQARSFFTLKKYMRETFGVDPQNKDAALQWLRDNGKLAA